MADNGSIQRIRTTLGDIPIDYSSLINKPETTKTLVLDKVKAGDFADAKAVATELQSITKKIENIQSSSSSGNQNVSTISTILRNNGITSSTNVMQDIKNINNKISSLSASGSTVSNADLKAILDANKLSKSTNITQSVSNLQSNVSNVENRISKLESSGGTTPNTSETVTHITNWNTATENGWYYSDNSSLSNDNSPGKLSEGLMYYLGNVRLFKVNSMTYVRQIVYAFIGGLYSVQKSYERNARLGNSNVWGEWYETTPMNKAITTTEFQNLLTD